MALGLAGVTALFLVAYWRAYGAINPVLIDSNSYLYFSPDRTIGYQLFLMLLGQVSTDLAIVSIVQLLLVGIGVALAAFAMFELTGSAVAAAALLILSFGYPAPMKFVGLVLTEGPSLALAALFVALVLAFARRPRFGIVVALAILVGTGVAIRPTNAGFLLGAVVAIWFLADRGQARLRWIGLVCAAFAIGYAASPVAHHFLAAERTADDPAIRGLFGRALLAPGSDAVRARACGMASLDPITRPVKRYLATAPAELRPFLQERYTDYLRFYVILPEIMARHGYATAGEAGPMLKCYALATLREHPGYFVRQAASAHWGILSYRNYDWPGFATRLLAFQAASPMPLSPTSGVEVPPPSTAGLRPTAAWRTPAVAPRPAFGSDDLFTPPLPRNVWLVRALGAVLIASAGISLLCLLALPFTRSRSVTVAGVAALGAVVHSVILASALFEVPIPRYFYPIWPLIVAILVWAGHGLFRSLLQRGLLSRRMR